MLPEVGLPELLLIAVVALVLGKPEDLPEIMRKLGVLAASIRNWMNGLWAGLEEQAEMPNQRVPNKVRPVPAPLPKKRRRAKK